MRIVVQKYGGSSVATVAKIRAIAQSIAQLKATGVAVVVVVSAMGNTTDELITLAHDICDEPDRREMDMLLSVGERVSMALLAIALRSLGVAAVSLTGSQSGIVTDESHTDASIVEVRPTRVMTALKRGDVVIVAGFQGVSREREVTTLGRGGSDTTAVAMAAALKAECCEIYTDVDGVYSADPNVVNRAQKIEQMSLEQALVMANSGAKVLYEDAVAFAQAKGIEIVVKLAHGPGSGTRIKTRNPEIISGVVAIASDRHVSKMTLADMGNAGAYEQWMNCVRMVIPPTIYLDTRNQHQATSEAVVQVALVSIIGTGVLAAGILKKAEQALVANQIEARLVVADEQSIKYEVAEASADAAVQALHMSLIESEFA